MGCVVLILLSTTAWPAIAEPRSLRGCATASEAAAPEPFSSQAQTEAGHLFNAAQPDSSVPAGGYFEEEEEGKHLYRDIGIFLIVSAFVGYFIVKVFLEGETEETPPDDGGKGIPNPFSFELNF